MSNFTFLPAEWPALHAAANKAETYALIDARTACVSRGGRWSSR